MDDYGRLELACSPQKPTVSWDLLNREVKAQASRNTAPAAPAPKIQKDRIDMLRHENMYT